MSWDHGTFQPWMNVTASFVRFGVQGYPELPLPTFGEGNGNPLQYSCLENPMDGGAWWAAVHGVAKIRA